jgi:cell division ATPase FtsA
MIKLPFFSKKNKNPSKFLTLDISATSVRCLVFYEEEDNLKIIGYCDEPLQESVVRAGNIIDLQDVADAIVSAISTATQNLEEDVTDAIIGLTGDLCLGITTTVRLKRKTKAPLSAKEIQSLYDKTREAAHMQAQNEYLQTMGNDEADLEVITSATVFTSVDNQLVDTLQNAEGKLVHTAIFHAFSPLYHLDALKLLAKKAGINIMAVGSELYAITQYLRESSKENVDFVLIDIAADTTNVAVVFGGGIVSTKSLNVGKYHFTEGVSNKMGLTLVEAERMLNAYVAGELSQSESSIVQTGLQDSLEIWLEGIELLFSEFTGVKTFSSRIFLTGEGADIPDLLTMVKEEPWTKGIPFKSPPEFRKVNFMDLENISDSTGRITTSAWIPTASLSIIYRELNGNDKA